MSTFTDGLRAVADWYDAHPDISLPEGCLRGWLSTLEEAAETARALGRCRKEFIGDVFALERDFGGGVALRFLASRGTVCTRRVTGTRMIPAQPAQPERPVDIVEWDCHSVLVQPDDQDRTRADDWQRAKGSHGAAHPDKGGNHDEMAKLTAARDLARKVLLG